jgi:AcrR family transcriptional regulator
MENLAHANQTVGSSLPKQRPLRADAKKSIQQILEIADQVLDRDSTATLQEIARAAGVTRTTVYRHFANREALIARMVKTRAVLIEDALTRAQIDTAPPLVAIHQLTKETLQINARWRFTSSIPLEHLFIQQEHVRIKERLDQLVERAKAEGLFNSETPTFWIRTIFVAIMRQAKVYHSELNLELNELASLVVSTLLSGISPKI